MNVVSRVGIGDDIQADLLEAAVPLDSDSFPADPGLRLPGLLDCRAQIHEKAFPGHLQHVEAGDSRASFQVAARAPAELDHFHRLVDDDARRRVMREHDAVRLPECVNGRQRAGGGLALRGPGGGMRRDRLRVVEHRTGDPRLLRKELVVFVLGPEEVAERADRLRRAEQQEAVRIEGMVEDREDALLQPRLEIDEQVAAGEQVQVEEGRIGQDVVPGENAGLPSRLCDLVIAVPLHEEPPQALGRNVRRRVVGVNARARLLDRGLADVGPEDLQGKLAAVRLARFDQADDEGVDLFAGRASRDPQPHRRVLGPVLQDPRKDLALEKLERLPVAEEAGHPDEHVLVERVHLAGVLLEKVVVLPEIVDLLQRHTPRDPALDGGLPVMGEVHARGGAQQREDLVGDAAIGRRRLLRDGLHQTDVRMTGDPRQLARDVLGTQDEIHAARRDRGARHAVMAGGVFLLREGDPSLGLDGFDPEGAVGGRAGQNDSDRAGLQAVRERPEEVVHRHVTPVGLSPGGESKMSVVELHHAVGRNHVDLVGLDPHRARGLADRHARVAGEDLRQQTLMCRVQMLDDDEGHARVRGDVAEQLAEGLESPC